MLNDAMSNTPNKPMTPITSETPFPWAIHRDITLDDGTTLKQVRIVAEAEDYYCGGDWYADLNATHALRNLSDEQRDEAMTAAADILDDVAYQLENGDEVSAT